MTETVSSSTEKQTPWRRVFERFGMTQNALAEAAGWDRSKVSRALADPDGYINGKDQAVLMALGKKMGIAIPLCAFLPVVE